MLKKAGAMAGALRVPCLFDTASLEFFTFVLSPRAAGARARPACCKTFRIFYIRGVYYSACFFSFSISLY